MSQHQFHTQHNGKPVVVQLGFDRPLGHFHLVVLDPANPDDPVYTNLDEEDAFGRSLDDYRNVLADLGISVPESMFEQTELDGGQRRGNRFVIHQADGSFTDALGCPSFFL